MSTLQMFPATTSRSEVGGILINAHLVRNRDDSFPRLVATAQFDNGTHRKDCSSMRCPASLPRARHLVVDVIGIRARQKMRRVHAFSIIASVPELQRRVRKLPVRDQKRIPMRQHRAVRCVLEDTVAISIAAARPIPTSSRAAECVDARPEACNSFLIHRGIPLGQWLGRVEAPRAATNLSECGGVGHV